ncbi:unnamed protein product [Calicophoron daubneyi]|uniref:Uncharacterized protein n=1 Tax=Calicophoron daubneyi TaxID=300641 RepID=A0AAV2TRJ1_CALDB
MTETTTCTENWDPRYIRSWKCQVSVGELYRWILAKLSDKDIKRALHKYRDLMPRQSDWNRKLTQATSMPELGFRYLYRCGQIDESNHRTMQKMLKYIDRQDVLPYFDTILYNTNYANCSLNDLQKVLLDKVDVFLELSSALTDQEVHPEPPYEIHRCQPVETLRMTRARAKRKSEPTNHGFTVAKRMRYSLQGSLTASDSSSDISQEQIAVGCCDRVRSAMVANALSGPVIHTLLSTSLVSLLKSLRATLSQAFDSSGISSASSMSLDGENLLSSGSGAGNSLYPSRLLAAMPQLLALASANFIPNHLIPGQPRSRQQQPPQSASRSRSNQQPIRHYLLPNQPVLAPQAALEQGGQVRVVPAPDVPRLNNLPVAVMLPGLHNPIQQQVPAVNRLNNLPFFQQPNADGAPPPPLAHARQPVNPPVQLKQVVLSAGGVGITASPHDSLIQYYCNIKLRIAVDLGPSTETLARIRTDRQDAFEQQIDRFVQASTLLRSRSPGEFVCQMRFNQLNQLEAFWRDYQSGLLKKILMDMLLGPTSRSFVGRSLPSSGVPNNSAGGAGSSVAQVQQQAVPAWGRPAPFVPQQVGADAVSFSNPTFAPWLIPATVVAMAAGWADGETYPSTSSQSFNLENSTAYRSPLLALADAIALVRQREFGSSSANIPSNFSLNLFISRREYENGRCLLMRNLRAIPSLCRLVAVSELLPTSPTPGNTGEANASSGGNTSTPSNSFSTTEENPPPSSASVDPVVSESS